MRIVVREAEPARLEDADNFRDFRVTAPAGLSDAQCESQRRSGADTVGRRIRTSLLRPVGWSWVIFLAFGRLQFGHGVSRPSVASKPIPTGCKWNVSSRFGDGVASYIC